MIEEVIKFAKFYFELGYSIEDAITMAINIVREIDQLKYEIGGLDEYRNNRCRSIR